MISKIITALLLTTLSLSSLADKGMIKGILSGVNIGWELIVDKTLRFKMIDINTNQSKKNIWKDVIKKYPFKISFNSDKKTIFIEKAEFMKGEIVNLGSSVEIIIKPVKIPDEIHVATVKLKKIVQTAKKKVVFAPESIANNQKIMSKFDSIKKSLSGVNLEILNIRESINNLNYRDNKQHELDSLAVTSISEKISSLQQKQIDKVKIIMLKVDELSGSTSAILKHISNIKPDNTLNSNGVETAIASINSLIDKIQRESEINTLIGKNNKLAINILSKKNTLQARGLTQSLGGLKIQVAAQMNLYREDLKLNLESVAEIISIVNESDKILLGFQGKNIRSLENLDNEISIIHKTLDLKFSTTQDIIINIAKSLKKDIDLQFKYLTSISKLMDQNSKVIIESVKQTEKSNNKVIDAITDSKQSTSNNHKITVNKIDKIANSVAFQNESIDKINKENELIKRTRGESDVVVRLLINSLFDVHEARNMIVTDVFARKTGLRHINIHIGSMILKYGSSSNGVIRNKDIKLTLNDSGLVQIEGIRGSDDAYYLINKWYHEKYKKLTSSGSFQRFETDERKLYVKFNINSESGKVVNDMRSLGQSIYENNCYNCHESGFGGSFSKSDRDYWDYYKSTNTLKMAYTHVVNGVGKMPKKGTCYLCSEIDLKESIRYLTGMKN